MRIPITMCHGMSPSGDYPLTEEHFGQLVGIASGMGFSSINYDQLAAWRAGTGELPERPIMFDFDHPVKSMRHEVHATLARHGYAGNLFINTGPMLGEGYGVETMTWEEAGELVELGWHIGAHTVGLSLFSRRFCRRSASAPRPLWQIYFSRISPPRRRTESIHPPIPCLQRVPIARWGAGTIAIGPGRRGLGRMKEGRAALALVF